MEGILMSVAPRRSKRQLAQINRNLRKESPSPSLSYFHAPIQKFWS